MEAAKEWILVTGGSRGIGKGLVEDLAVSGHDVVFTYRSPPSEPVEVENLLHERGVKVRGYCCDGSNETAVSDLVSKLMSEFGPPRALVNNAGVTADALMLKMSTEQWDRVIDTNLRSVFLFSRLIIPAMIERRDGVILNMSSVSAIKGNIGQTNYAATKAAILGVTRSLALETARFNVRVNAILPGLVDTEMLRTVSERDRAALEKQVPMRRLCRISEVAGLARYLLSDEASYITGQSFVIDGGLTA